MNDNLINYLVEKSKADKSTWIDIMRYDLSGSLYGHGEQFNKTKKPRFIVFEILKDCLEFLIIYLNKCNHNTTSKTKILSSAYSTWNSKLEAEGYNVYNPVWNLRANFKIKSSFKLYLLTKKIKRSFVYRDFNYLISDEFIGQLQKFYELFKDSCFSENYAALIVPQDVGFFEKISILVFQELKRPTVFWAHGGMPNRYDGEMGNRTDYSVQWGQIQVDSFVKMGYNREKFFISGHPFYDVKPINVKFSFERILVLTKPLTGVSPEKNLVTEDIGNSIMYLRSIQNVLQKIGISQVYLRPHPSENFDWYRKYLDETFFLKDLKVLSESLKLSSLVVGPVSTTFIDALHHSVNYIVYEPLIKDFSIYGRKLHPPMDFRDPRVPMATSEIQLEELLVNKQKIDVDIYEEFVKTPSDVGFFKTIIEC